MNHAPRVDVDQAWAFCLHLWEQPGVADALLRRQQEEGLDVLLHLFSRYAQERLGLVWNARMDEAAAAAVKPWRERTVLGLRAMRQAIKATPLAPGSTQAQLLDHLKQAEVLAEKAELAQLCAWLETRSSQR